MAPFFICMEGLTHSEAGVVLFCLAEGSEAGMGGWVPVGLMYRSSPVQP